MERCLFIGVLAGIALGPTVRADARPRLGGLAGGQCDAPSVEDAQTFDSSCSVAPRVGFLAIFDGPRPLGLEVEASYARRSFSSPAFVTGTPVRMELVELALLARVPLHESASGFHVAALGGPEVGFVTSVRRRLRDVDQDVTGELRSSDFRLRGAVRITKEHRGFEIFFEGGLAWGFRDLDDTNQQQIRSRALLFAAGVTR